MQSMAGLASCAVNDDPIAAPRASSVSTTLARYSVRVKAGGAPRLRGRATHHVGLGNGLLLAEDGVTECRDDCLVAQAAQVRENPSTSVRLPPPCLLSAVRRLDRKRDHDPTGDRAPSLGCVAELCDRGRRANAEALAGPAPRTAKHCREHVANRRAEIHRQALKHGQLKAPPSSGQGGRRRGELGPRTPFFMTASLERLLVTAQRRRAQSKRRCCCCGRCIQRKPGISFSDTSAAVAVARRGAKALTTTGES
jgi:hypothetical protein